MVIDLKANEVVVKAGNSKYIAETEKISGKLIVTNQRIYFKSTNGHVDRYDLEIMPSDISEVIYFSNGLMSAPGLNIVMKSGEENRFCLKKRNEMGLLINKMY